jgi:ribonucleotide reductase beta subunit family protein with ferritin-like domain
MEQLREADEDYSESQLNRKEVAVWMRENCDVSVDFEDWDGLSDQEVWVLVWTIHGIDMHKVVDAMKEEHEV